MATVRSSLGGIINHVLGIIVGNVAPTNSTFGRVGQIYIDITDRTAYICVSAKESRTQNIFTWSQVTGGGGKGTPITIETDSGAASELGGVIKVFGANGVTTSGSSNAVIVKLDGNTANVSSVTGVLGALAQYDAANPGEAKIKPVIFAPAENGNLLVVHGNSIATIPNNFYSIPAGTPQGAILINKKGTAEYITPVSGRVLTTNTSGDWELVDRDSWGYGDMHAASHTTAIGQLVLTNDKTGREYKTLDASTAADGSFLAISRASAGDTGTYVFKQAVTALTIEATKHLTGNISLVAAGLLDLKYDKSSNTITLTGLGGGGAGNMVSPVGGVTAGALVTYADAIGHITKEVPYGPGDANKILAVNADGDGFEFVSKPPGTHGVMSDSSSSIVGNIPKASNTSGDHISFTRSTISDDGDIVAKSLVLSDPLPITSGGTGVSTIAAGSVLVTDKTSGLMAPLKGDAGGADDNKSLTYTSAGGWELETRIKSFTIDAEEVSASGVVALETDTTLEYDNMTKKLGVSNPLDATVAGSMYYAAGGVVTSLSPGTDGQVLTLATDSLGALKPEWATGSAPGPAPEKKVVNIQKPAAGQPPNALSQGVIYVCDDVGTDAEISSASVGEVFTVIGSQVGAISVTMGGSVSLVGNGGVTWSATTKPLVSLDAWTVIEMTAIATDKLVVTSVTGNYVMPLPKG